MSAFVLDRQYSPRLHERLEEISREIGTLLLTFAPLDAVVWRDQRERESPLLLFLFAGALFILVALWSEQRRNRE